MKRFVLLSALVAVSAGAAVPAYAEDQAKPVKEKKVCRRYDTTGSIMTGKMVCHSKSEWASIDQANAEKTNSAIDPHGQFGGHIGPQ